MLYNSPLLLLLLLIYVHGCICFAVGDESQELDTRVLAARPVGEGAANTDVTLRGVAEVPLDKSDAANWYSQILCIT